jgi:hypothetical protein
VVAKSEFPHIRDSVRGENKFAQAGNTFAFLACVSAFSISPVQSVSLSCPPSSSLQRSLLSV